MHRALLELIVRGLRGRILRMARLVRQPKYLVGSIIGLSYLGWFVARPFLTGGMVMNEVTAERIPPEFLLGLHMLAALSMALYLSVTWTLLPAKAPLRLREPELQLLLPAPVGRRTVIQYALAKSIPGILIGAIVITALFSSGGIGHRLARGAGVFVLFVLWDLHGKGRSLWRMQLADMPPARALPRRVLMFAAVAVFWAMAVSAAVEVGREVLGVVRSHAGFSEDVLRQVAAAGGAALDQGWLRILLAPLLLIAGPFLGQGVYPMPLSWLALLALVAFHYVWVVNSQARFEDELLEKERRRAAEGPRRKGRPRLRLTRDRRASAPFRLGPVGRPETAIFWKDLLVATRYRLGQLAGWAGAGLVLAAGVACIPSGNRGIAEVVGSLAAMTALGTPLLSSTLWSNGFRRDLKHFELLRTWPVASHRMVVGQILAPWAQSTALIVFALAVVLVADLSTYLTAGLGWREGSGLVPRGLAEGLGLAPVLLPAVAALSLFPLLVAVSAFASSLECLAALAFPGWLISFDRHRGDPAAIGNRILVVLAFGIIMLLAVVPVAMVLGMAALVHGMLELPVAGWELPFLGLLAAAPIAFETWLVVRAAGRLWAGLDPSRELLEGFS